MNWLFLILLLLNAGLFIWGQQQPNPLPLPQAEGNRVVGNGNLLLLSEIDGATAAAPVPTDPAPSTPSPPRHEQLPGDDTQNTQREMPPEHTMVVEQEPLVPATAPDQPPTSAHIPLDQIASFNDQSPIEPNPALSAHSEPAAGRSAPSRPPREKPADATEQAIYLPPLNPPQGSGDGIATNFSVDLAPPPRAYRCGILESIADELTGYRIVEQMQMRNISAHLTKDPGDGASFWVLIPPQPTRGQANEIVSILANQGFTDTWLVDRGDLENAISLGLFNNRQNAQHYMTRIARLGLPVELKRQQNERPGYAIHFPIGNQISPDTSAWLELQSLYPSLKLRTARCEAK